MVVTLTAVVVNREKNYEKNLSMHKIAAVTVTIS